MGFQLGSFGKWIFGLMMFSLAIYVPLIIGGKIYGSILGLMKKAALGLGITSAGMGAVIKRGGESLTRRGSRWGGAATWLGNRMLSNPVMAFRDYWTGVQKESAEATRSTGWTRYVAGRQGQIEQIKADQGAIAGKDASYIYSQNRDNIQQYLKETAQGREWDQLSERGRKGMVALQELEKQVQEGSPLAGKFTKEAFDTYTNELRDAARGRGINPNLIPHALDTDKFATHKEILAHTGLIVHPTGTEKAVIQPGGTPEIKAPVTPVLSSEAQQRIQNELAELEADANVYVRLDSVNRGLHDTWLSDAQRKFGAGNIADARAEASKIWTPLVVAGWTDADLKKRLDNREFIRQSVSRGYDVATIKQQHGSSLVSKEIIQQGAANINLAAAGNSDLSGAVRGQNSDRTINETSRNIVHQTIERVVQNIERDPVIQQRMSTAGVLSRDSQAMKSLRDRLYARPDMLDHISTLANSARQNAGKVDLNDTNVQRATDALYNFISSEVRSKYGV